VDFESDTIYVRESKTQAGKRTIPMSVKCKQELLRWRNFLGPQFSVYVFPNMSDASKPMTSVRRGWARTLKDANLPFFWLYDLRHTLASRLTHAGVSPLFVAQIIGHSGTSILNTYVRAIDEYRLDAIHKLEKLRDAHIPNHEGVRKPAGEPIQ
jgi:integrase